MTYQDDPNINRRTSVQPRAANEGWGTGSIVLASLAALAVVFGIFYAMSNRADTSMANRDNTRPAVTTTSPTNTPAATTGSGAANRTPDSTGTKPAMPAQVPAPASPAANR